MLFEGIKLMFVGMTTVMLFLVLMILFINFVAILTRGVTARELQSIRRDREIQTKKRKKAKKDPVGSDTNEDIAVIAAAVAAYEAERFATV